MPSSDGKGDLNPLQDGCRSFLELAFLIPTILVSGFGALWAFATFVWKTGLQTMPDQNGVVHSNAQTGLICLALIFLPWMFYGWVHGKLHEYD